MDRLYIFIQIHGLDRQDDGLLGNRMRIVLLDPSMELDPLPPHNDIFALVRSHTLHLISNMK